MTIFSLYLVTERGNLPLETFFKIIQSAIDGGVNIIQLREKQASAREMIFVAKQLHAFTKPLGIPLIINDRVDVAHAVGAEGVHLGQSDLSVSDARAILGKEKIIGLSVESLEQAWIAQKEDVNYLAASPTFHTQTKLDCQPAWGLQGLKQLCNDSHHPIVAIGGINETNIKNVRDCGVAGVAVISAIFNAPCPQTAANRLLTGMK